MHCLLRLQPHKVNNEAERPALRACRLRSTAPPLAPEPVQAQMKSFDFDVLNREITVSEGKAPAAVR
jgi:hypothetical protein